MSISFGIRILPEGRFRYMRVDKFEFVFLPHEPYTGWIEALESKINLTLHRDLYVIANQFYTETFTGTLQMLNLLLNNHSNPEEVAEYIQIVREVTEESGNFEADVRWW
jgi:hypothetical protein